METLSQKIIAKALEFGASCAGIASVEALQRSPSHSIFGRLDRYQGVGARKTGEPSPAEIHWPAGAESVLTVALAHPDKEPRLDWWRDGYRGGTEGNRELIEISDELTRWLLEGDIHTFKLPYHIEEGGIFLKDAAVLGGLGCLGKNNLLITPQYGPRVRLRALTLDAVLPGTGEIPSDPCHECPMPCRDACPQEAFREQIYSEKRHGVGRLPGGTGDFSRDLCNIQMELDVRNGETVEGDGQSGSGELIRFCRACELACPVGRSE